MMHAQAEDTGLHRVVLRVEALERQFLEMRWTLRVLVTLGVIQMPASLRAIATLLGG